MSEDEILEGAKEVPPEVEVDPAIFREPGRVAIGVDVGGSGIKAAAVDVRHGRLVSHRIRVATPSPSTQRLWTPRPRTTATVPARSAAAT